MSNKKKKGGQTLPPKVDAVIERSERMLANYIKALDNKKEPLTTDDLFQIRETLKVLCAHRELINQVRDEKKGMKIAGMTPQYEIEDIILEIQEGRGRKSKEEIKE